MTDESELQFTAREFRDALSSFATGVTVVTACDAEGECVGMTASSFNSVSTDPPLVLWSVTKTALSAPAFKEAKHFAIHILATDQTDLSNLFATSGADKFGETDFVQDENGVPCIAGAATRFNCSTWAVYEGGDHWIIVGRVNSIERGMKEGLVFGGGAYATAAPLTTIGQIEQTSAGSSAVLEDMLFYNLSRAYHQMGHAFHEAVRKSGLTVAEWRICASLYAQATLSIQQLAQQTFLDPKSLADIVATMSEDGLCTVSNGGGSAMITGTKAGHDRVAHLIALAREHEKRALSDIEPQHRESLVKSLKTIVESTPPVE